MRSSPRRLLSLLAALTVVAAACSGSDDAAPATTIPADVDAVLAAAAEAMGAVDTVRFSIERGGAPVFIEIGSIGDLVEFKSAEGRYTSPGSADALVTVNAGGFNTQVGALAIDGQIWLSFLGSDWQPAPPSYQFDPASLFDPNQGFRQLFVDGLSDVTLIGEETRDGIATYHIRGTAGEERVEFITASLVRNQSVELDAWIDGATGELVDAAFTTQVSDGTATWELTFREYGAEVTIEAPDLDAGG